MFLFFFLFFVFFFFFAFFGNEYNSRSSHFVMKAIVLSLLDIDECTTSEDGPCDKNATCTNAPESFICSCNEGYTGDGFKCAGKQRNLCLSELQ